MKKGMINRTKFLSLFLLSLFFVFGATSLKAENSAYTYTENFTNTIYKDVAGTTAIWNYMSGELTLPTENKSQRMPSIDFSSDKELLVSWVGPMVSGNVYAQKLDKNGNRIWANDIKVGPQSSEQHTVGEKPVVVKEPVASGNYMNVFWQDSRDHKLTFQTINSDGSARLPIWGIQEMKLSSSNAVSGIDAAHYSNNAYTPSYVVWVDNRNKNGGDIYLQKIEFGASYPEYQWSSDVKVNSLQSGFQGSPRVAVDSNGDVYVVWSSGIKGGSAVSPTDGGIFMQKFSSSGVRLWSSDIIVSQEGSNPSIDIDLSSDTPAVYVSWQDITSSSYNSRKYDAYIQKFDLNGNVAWSDSYRIESGLTSSGLISSPSPIVAANKKSHANGYPVHIAWYSASEKRIKIQGYRQDVTGEVICQYGSNCVGTSYASINGPVFSSDFKGEFDFLQGALELLTDREPYFYLVWSESDKNGRDYDIFAQKFGKNGVSVWKKQVNDQDLISSSSVVAKSLSISDVEKDITRATLNATDEKPAGTDIDYYMSVNGGSDWELVSAGKEYVFANKGKDLRWMIALRSDNNTLAPIVKKISISYKTGDESIKLSPCFSYGDLDDDGFITTIDRDLMLDNSVGNVFLTAEQMFRTDLDSNGKIGDAVDINLMNQYIAGDISTFPACAKAQGCADLDANGKVDYRDLARVGSAANTCSGNSNYNAKYDLTGDNCINQIDPYIIENNYGKTTSCAQASSCPDINSDQVINYVDLARVGSALNTCSGDTGYNADADLNGDNCVNNAELIIIEKYFGVSPSTIDSCKKSIKVISPNGGEQWEIGKTYDITWRAEEFSDYEVLIVSLVNDELGKTCRLIDGYVNANEGKYSWKIGADNCSAYYGNKLKIIIGESEKGSNWLYLKDESDNYFSITNPSNSTCLPDGTLIKLPNDPKIYVIINCKRYWIRSVEEFQRKGYRWENVKISTPDVMNSLPEDSTSAQDIKEGSMIRVIGTNDIYIVKYIGNKKFKRLILNPSVFNSYGHLRWEDVIDTEEETVNSFTTSNLVRNAKTGRIYRLTANGDVGTRRHFRSISVMQKLGYDLDAVYEINETDRNSYKCGEDLK